MKCFWKHIYDPYKIFLRFYLALFICAFLLDSPLNLWNGLIAIVTSRSILTTDYIAIGGLGATLLNVVLVGVCSVCLLIHSKVKPNGGTIMGLWLTAGFSFFGKNIFNMIPISFGVYLYSRFRHEPYMNFSLVGLLSATISPIVSEISFLSNFSRVPSIILGIFIGIVVGFIFPIVSAFTVRVHDGYTLYNLGFSGGIIASFTGAILSGFAIKVEPAFYWSTGNNTVIAVILYSLSLSLIVLGVVLRGHRNIIKDLINILQHPGRLVSDFYILFGQAVYVNMGLLCILGTTFVLLIGADLNGPTISGILTMVGFGCFGKHLKNVSPVLIGALIGILVKAQDPSSPSSIIPILFSTGLAPIAGSFGPFWGALAGFLHVFFNSYFGPLSSGLNLYNNGYVTGFVALFLVPIITSLKKERIKKS